MPTPVRDHLDPFVVFERFFIAADQGFDTHPHRGFEIVSYILEGGMVHDDSPGESHTAYPGDAMRITTGSGIRHSELPADDAACNGPQLWVNLPRDRQDADPAFQDVPGDELPTAEVGDATVTTVVGSLFGNDRDRSRQRALIRIIGSVYRVDRTQSYGRSRNDLQ